MILLGGPTAIPCHQQGEEGEVQKIGHESKCHQIQHFALQLLLARPCLSYGKVSNIKMGLQLKLFIKVFLFFRSLIQGLLQTDVDSRMGGYDAYLDTVKSHEFFAQINWAEVADRKLTPPHVPRFQGPTDVSHFDEK